MSKNLSDIWKLKRRGKRDSTRHKELVREALLARKNVFVEKPLTINHSQSEELKDLASQKNLTNQVGYVNRFNPIFIRAKNLLTQGVIGNVTSYENMMYGNSIHLIDYIANFTRGN